MLVSVKRAVLIVNPYSTHVTGKRITAVERALRERVELRDGVHPAARATRPSSPPRSRHRVDAIVVFSGDGTYNEALNGADGAVPFGFLPGGGTSVFPRALGLPRDPVAAARAVGAALGEGPRCGGSRSAPSTGAASASRPGSASTPRRCGGSTSSGAARTAHGPATSRSCA